MHFSWKKKETVKSEVKGGLVKKTTQEDETPFNLIIVPEDAWTLCASTVLYNHI